MTLWKPLSARQARSHLSSSRPKCWGLRELPLSPPHISGQLSEDSLAACIHITHKQLKALCTVFVSLLQTSNSTGHRQSQISTGKY